MMSFDHFIRHDLHRIVESDVRSPLVCVYQNPAGCHRDAHVIERKIKKARAKKNRDLAERLAALRPKHRLDHLVKER